MKFVLTGDLQTVPVKGGKEACGPRCKLLDVQSSTIVNSHLLPVLVQGNLPMLNTVLLWSVPMDIM